MLKKLILIVLPILIFTGIGHSQDYHYEMSWDNPNSHLYKIKLETVASQGSATRFQIPAWRPGRYFLQDYAAGVSAFKAYTTEGEYPLEWKKTDKSTWEVKTTAADKVTIEYSFYANVMDAGSSVLTEGLAYFNGANIFMHVENRYDAACELTVSTMPKDWRSGTSLKKGKEHNVFSAKDYHDFIDAPTILSPDLKTLDTKISGVTYYLHFQGKFAGGEDVEKAVVENVGKIIKEQAAVFDDVPLKEYHFLYLLLPYNYRHAVEHAYSSCFTLPDRVANSVESLRGMYGITSHEFWHLWNVKRIRPAALWPYDYQKEQYTSLHWFTEGVTDYYTYLSLARCGLLTEDQFITNVQNNIASMSNNYATSIVSPSESSYESWVARSDYKDPNTNVSYYPLGSRTGMILDLEIMGKTNGKKSLDDVFKYLYENYYKKGKGVPEDGVMLACTEVTGIDFTEFFSKYVNGTEKVPYSQLLQPFGLKVDAQSKTGLTLDMIGVRRWEKSGPGFYVRSVHPESEAAAAGIGNGQFIVSIDDNSASDIDLEDFFKDKKAGDKIKVVLYRNGKNDEVKVEIKGNTAPKDYIISKRKRAPEGAEEMLKNWVGTNQ